MPSPRPVPPLEQTSPDLPRAPAAALAAAVALVTLAALALRLLVRADRPIWFDEGFSLALARGTWSDLRAMITGSDANGALHSILLWLWMRATEVFPADELARARALSAVAGAATVPALYGAGRALLGRGPALAAATLLAVNQLHAYYSHEARGYALLALLVTVASWLLVRALDAPSPARWAAYSAVAALSAYAHVLGGLSVAAQLVAALAHPSRPDDAPRRLRAVVAAGAAILAFVAPLLWYAATNPGYAAWIPPLRAAAVPWFFERMAGDTRVGEVSVWQALLVLEGACVVLAVAAAARLRRRDPRSREAWAILFLAASAFVPVALAVVISLVKPVFLDRYLLAVAPAWLLLVAAGLAARWRGRALAGAVALLVALSLAGTLQPRREDHPTAFRWDAVASEVLDRARPEDALVFAQAPGRVSFDHEARAHARAAEAPGLVWPPREDPLALRAPALAAMLGPLEARPRIWFVLFAEKDDSKALRATLEERGYAPALDVDLEGVRVLRYDR